MPEPSTVSFHTNEFNVDYVHINNEHAIVEICLYGGQVTRYTPKSDNRERLWVSPNSRLDSSKPVRGGVPICWPWFGDFKLSPLFSHPEHHDSHFTAHGFLRTRLWIVDSISDNENGTKLTLKPSSTKGEGFSQSADVSFMITVGDALTLDLVTTNSGSRVLSYSCALHTYFAVDDIEQTILEGLSGDYLDKPSGFKKLETPNDYKFTSETDRVHLCTAENISIHNGFKTGIKSCGHDSIVVWNPWAENSSSMQDMTDDGYKNMLCVETAVTQLPGITLAPGESHTLTQVID